MRLQFDNGQAVEANLVVGADGVRSMVGQWVTEGVAYSGTRRLPYRPTMHSIWPCGSSVAMNTMLSDDSPNGSSRVGR